MSGEKTEKPTPKRRKESRKEGQVPRTQELGGWGALLVVGAAAPLLLRHELAALRPSRSLPLPAGHGSLLMFRRTIAREMRAFLGGLGIGDRLPAMRA